MNGNIETLGDALPKEIQRVQELLPLYDGLPNGAGQFASAMMRGDIASALKAMAEGDVVGMLRAHESLKGYES